VQERVEKAELGLTFQVDFQAPPGILQLPNKLDLFARTKSGDPARATGASFVHQLNQTTRAPIFVGTTPIRTACGFTLVSPSFGFTAGHCASDFDELNPGDTIDVEMYRPEPKLANTWQSHTQLNDNGWPNFVNPSPLTAADGYQVDTFTCNLAARCGQGANKSSGSAFNCPASVDQSKADSALIQCAGRPGDRYGYLNVAATDVPMGPVVIHWKHEVYNIPVTAVGGDNSFADHYIVQPGGTPTGSFANNFHYFGGGKNQLLPLTSINWPGGVQTKKLTGIRFDGTVQTDAPGCHGTSGAGVLQQDPTTGNFDLLGPSRTGDPELNLMLCDHVPQRSISNLNIGPRNAGTPGINYTSLPEVQAIYNQFKDSIETGDCRVRPGASPFSADAFYFNSRCQKTFFRLPSVPPVWTLPVPIAAPRCSTVTCISPSGIDSISDSFGSLPGGSAAALAGLSLVAGARYRIAFDAISSCNCPPDQPLCDEACPDLNVTLQGQPALSLRLPARDTVSHLSAVVTAGSTGAADLQFAIARAPISLGNIAVVAEGAANHFDTPADRMEVSLVPVALGGSPGVMPMRCVGDGKSGFAAQLEPGERMVLTRQALVLSNLFARFSASSSAGMSCGVVDEGGAVVHRVSPCDPTRLVQLSSEDMIGTPAGFFVEIDTNGTTSVIDDFTVVSGAAPDADGDGIPDAVDNCPAVSNPAQEDCTAASAAAAVFATRTLTIDDRARVQDAAGLPSAVKNAGTTGGSTEIGSHADVGNLTSKPSVFLRDSARVDGSVVTTGTVTTQNNVVITGSVNTGVPVSLPDLTSFNVTFPPSDQGNVTVPPDQTISLTAGSYHRLTVNSRATVNLVGSTFFFDSIDLEPQSVVVLDDATSASFLYVRSGIIYRGTLREPQNVRGNVLLGYFGTSTASLESSFVGTFVAPRAKIDLASITAGHTGAFLGLDVEVHPDTTVTFLPLGAH
jgi:hypothetical protein